MMYNHCTMNVAIDSRAHTDTHADIRQTSTAHIANIPLSEVAWIAVRDAAQTQA